MTKTVIIIPARLESTRLPNKVLLNLGNKPMLQRVFEIALQAKRVDAVYIATDSPKIENVCQQFTKNIILTQKNHLSGTDRITEAAKSLNADFIINVQADEPFLQPSLIENLAAHVQKGVYPVVSAMHKLTDEGQIKDPANVKVVCDLQQCALYFSRSAIPQKPQTGQPWLVYKHIGVYAYQKDFLLQYNSWPPSNLEKTERLEQLRVLEHGYKIQMLLTDHEPLNIDTPENFKQAEIAFKHGK